MCRLMIFGAVKMITFVSNSCTDQTLAERKNALKLVPSNWRSIEAYSHGRAYTDVLKLFFSRLYKTSLQLHPQDIKQKVTTSFLRDLLEGL